MKTPFLYKVKHDHVMIDGRIMPIGVIIHYIMLFKSFYFLHRFTDVNDSFSLVPMMA
jgi:hypothetical protein